MDADATVRMDRREGWNSYVDITYPDCTIDLRLLINWVISHTNKLRLAKKDVKNEKSTILFQKAKTKNNWLDFASLKLHYRVDTSLF